MTSSTLGVSPPPPGVTPNFDNPKSIAYRIIVPAVIGPAIAIPVCILRLYTKRYILRLVTSDDYAIVLATLLALAYSIGVCYQTTNGLGTLYFWDIPAYKWHRFLRVGGFVGPITYNLSAGFTKISLSLLYLRLSQSLSLSFRIAIYVVMGVSTAYCLIAALGPVWLCQPIPKYWDYSIPGKCADFNIFFLTIGCINAATDLTLLILPIRIIYHLHLPWARKISAAVLLMTGSFVCVVGIIRVRIVVLSWSSVATDGTTTLVVVNTYWLIIEMWLAIICACLPSLYNFFRNCFSFAQNRGDKPDVPVAQHPNNIRSHNHIPTSLPESAYYSGEASNFSLGTVHDRPTSGHVHIEAATV